MFRIYKAKRSIQSNDDKPAEAGKLFIGKGIFSSTATVTAGKKDDSDKKSQTTSLFNFSMQATAGGAANGQSTTLFGGSTGGSLFGGFGAK